MGAYNVITRVILTPEKLKTLSEIARDVGQVFFASMFIGPLVIGSVNWPLIITGFLVSLIFWLLSLLMS
jgi:hypothetical protein